MTEKLIASAAAKWVTSSSVMVQGTLYLTTKRLCFEEEKKAPIVLTGSEVHWTNTKFLWEMALLITREATPKIGFTGPALTILDARNMPWTFILNEPKHWATLINDTLKSAKQ